MDLRDPIWIFWLSLVIAVAGIGLWVFQARDRKHKELTYEVVAKTRLLSLASTPTDIKQRLEIRLDGRPVQDIDLVLIKLRNSGNVDIPPTDFIRPLLLSFG